jgi:uncharacterized membrane protein
MRVKLGNGLIILNVLAIALILCIIFIPSSIIRLILGVPFLLFVPGYALMAALFTKKEGMGGIARVALSFILSIALVALIGFILNYTPWGIRLEPVLYAIFAFVLISSFVAWWRQRKLSEQERFSIEINIKFPGLGQSIWDKTLAIILVITILGAIGVVSYTIIKPKPREAFTEFYILGQGGKAGNYPVDLYVGVKSSVGVGIINHEGKEVSYRVEVLMSGKKLTETGPITMVDGQKWENAVDIIPEEAGDNQKLEFLLYKGDELKPYLEPIYLWVNVSE